MSGLEKAILLIVAANIIQFVVGYFSNRSSRNDSKVEEIHTRMAVLERDVFLLRQDIEKKDKG